MTEGMSAAELFLVRIGDEERERCLDVLAEHHVRGRLGAEELDRRQRAALGAVTAADLAALLADLPSSAAPAASPRTPNAPEHGRWDLREAAVRATPPAVVVGASALISTVVADAAGVAPSAGMFWMCTLTGAAGYATHWASSRLRGR